MFIQTKNHTQCADNRMLRRVVLTVLFAMLLSMTSLLALAQGLSPQEMEKHLSQKVGENFVQELTYLEELGLYEVRTADKIVFYVDESGDTMTAGTLFALTSNVPTNVTEQRLQEHAKNISAVVFDMPDTKKVVYPADGEEIAVLQVFTDPYCGYCRRFHKEYLPLLNAEGVTVEYLSFAVIAEESRDTASGIWCLSSQKLKRQALDAIKLNNQAPDANTSCYSTVDTERDIAFDLGARGTPFMLLEDGTTSAGLIGYQDLMSKIKAAAQ